MTSHPSLTHMNLGHAEIDQQHEKMLGLADEILAGFNGGLSADSLLSLFKEFRSAVSENFLAENDLMKSCAGSINVIGHKKEHKITLLLIDHSITYLRRGVSINKIKLLMNYIMETISFNMMNYDVELVQAIAISTKSLIDQSGVAIGALRSLASAQHLPSSYALN